MALIESVEMLVQPYGKTREWREPMQSLHDAMSMPMVIKRLSRKIGYVERSKTEIQNDYKFVKASKRGRWSCWYTLDQYWSNRLHRENEESIHLGKPKSGAPGPGCSKLY